MIDTHVTLASFKMKSSSAFAISFPCRCSSCVNARPCPRRGVSVDAAAPFTRPQRRGHRRRRRSVALRIVAEVDETPLAAAIVGTNRERTKISSQRPQRYLDMSLSQPRMFQCHVSSPSLRSISNQHATNEVLGFITNIIPQAGGHVVLPSTNLLEDNIIRWTIEGWTT